MLYDMSWLQPGKIFPPQSEVPRLTRYAQNAMLFDGDHFSDPIIRSRNSLSTLGVDVYAKCAERIQRVIGNFDEVISFPVLLNYQRMMSLKMADLVCGEYPAITGSTVAEDKSIKTARDYTCFDDKLYSTVLDISRYGDALWRVYKDDRNKYTFTCWTPLQWFPIVAQDGTNTVLKHCICWRENKSLDVEHPNWHLYVQEHGTTADTVGAYNMYEYQMTSDGETIESKLSEERIETGLSVCAIFHLKAFSVSDNVYGYDDYMPIDSLLAEIMSRIGQISIILDKHADPNITGPVSMLSYNETTGEYVLNTGKFFAVSPGEEQPKYMTWDGQLSAAFKQLEILINQLYILSEMGAALLGGQDSSVTAISGTAMRFKMINPLAKARRIANSMTRYVRYLFGSVCNPEVDAANISVVWADGLPDDPKENIENAKLASGEAKLIPLEQVIMEFFGRSNAEAKRWIKQIRESEQQQQQPDINHPGPNTGGVNPAKHGSTLGLNAFHSQTNNSGTGDRK